MSYSGYVSDLIIPKYFNHSIINAIPNSGHGLYYFRFFQFTLKNSVCIADPSITMKDWFDIQITM